MCIRDRFQGTPVLAVTAGGIEIADDSSGTPSVILGIFGGCFYTDPTTSKPTFSNYYPASTNASDLKASVYADPNIVYEAQHDGTGTAALNHTALDFTGTSGSTITGQSTSELDTDTNATDNGFKQIGISHDPDNSDTSAANCNAYCVFNVGEHVFKVDTALA